MDWLQELRNLPPNRRAVQHHPETPRYARARAKLRYIIERGIFLGIRQHALSGNAVEVAVWAPPGHGTGAGYYCCFRLLLEQEEVAFAVLFCFYDGTERSPGFKGVSAARTFAAANGFTGGPYENHH